MADVGETPAEEGAEGELVPGEQVSEARPLARVAEAGTASPVVARRASLPATLAAASGGAILGVAAFMLLRVLRRPGAARRVAGRRGGFLARRRGVEVAATRSFLVDVHLLKR